MLGAWTTDDGAIGLLPVEGMFSEDLPRNGGKSEGLESVFMTLKSDSFCNHESLGLRFCRHSFSNLTHLVNKSNVKARETSNIVKSCRRMIEIKCKSQIQKHLGMVSK